MSEEIILVIFRLEKQQFALHLTDVERVVHSLEMQRLKIAPMHIAGTVNIEGQFLPVVNMRNLFGFPTRALELTDHFILAKAPGMRLVLWVDSADEVVTIPAGQIGEPENVMIRSVYVEGIFKLGNGIVLINDLARFFTPDQIELLTAQLEKYQPATHL